MQWINLVPEDAGIQNLKADNRRPVITRNVDAVSPYPSTHATRIGKGTQRDAGRHRERRSGDRRTGNDRRKQQVPVLLDTRSKHDRRAIGNRRSEETAEPQSPHTSSTDIKQAPHRIRLNLYA